MLGVLSRKVTEREVEALEKKHFFLQMEGCNFMLCAGELALLQLCHVKVGSCSVFSALSHFSASVNK